MQRPTCHEQSAKEGTLHILREALKAGIEKIVVTSTCGTTMDRTSVSEYDISPWYDPPYCS
jgi:nucleoside-diphosphate-sugar epimerase